MNRDDLDDLDLGGEREAKLEARFQELEREAELEKLRRKEGLGGHGPEARPTGNDPLSKMKAALDGEGKRRSVSTARVLLLCPSCGAKNRTNLEKLRKRLPLCGGCKKPLSFE